MGCRVAIGSQWGDEGKAKMIDFFTKDSDIVVRYQGGANAGHTVVVNKKKYIFHLVPSGILHEDKICVIGNGVVLDPVQLIDELKSLYDEGIITENRLMISDSAHLILPYHKAMDEAMEEYRNKKLGTTIRGIGPSYSDKCLRIGIRVGDIFDMERIEQRVDFALNFKNIQFERIYERPPVNKDEIMDIINMFRDTCSDMIRNTQEYLHASLKEGKNILLEGAQGFGLDIDHGTYPYVTSSNPTIGGALLGTGLNASNIREVVGIAKAYVTRVGEGPFPTEDFTDDGERLRVNGKEFGSTTGRPRRCGWFDVALMKQSAMINGLTSIALTKLDILKDFKKIKVSVGYISNGKEMEYCPVSQLDNVTPIYEELDGWDENIGKCETYEDLPKNAKKYIEFLEEKTGVHISHVSVGPSRHSTIVR